MKKKMQYDTPQVEILGCRVEKGFAGSNVSPNPIEGNTITPLDVETSNLPQFS